jgi:hypothetical protein
MIIDFATRSPELGVLHQPQLFGRGISARPSDATLSRHEVRQHVAHVDLTADVARLAATHAQLCPST